MKIINGESLILGRVATAVAQEVLSGEEIHLVNCDKIVITGQPKKTIKRYKEKYELGSPQKGPFFFKKPNLFVKRAIRGMLPYKRKKGKEAFKKLKCYIDLPENLKEEKMITFEKYHVKKVPNLFYITVGRLCQELGK